MSFIRGTPRLEIEKVPSKEIVIVRVFVDLEFRDSWYSSNLTFRINVSLWGDDQLSDDVLPLMKKQGRANQLVSAANTSLPVLVQQDFKIGSEINEDDSWFDNRDEIYAKVTLRVGFDHDVESFVGTDPEGVDYLKTNTVKGYF